MKAKNEIKLLRKIGPIEIMIDRDGYGQRRYTAVDPNGYLGRTRICESWAYNNVLRGIREYRKNTNQ